MSNIQKSIITFPVSAMDVDQIGFKVGSLNRYSNPSMAADVEAGSISVTDQGIDYWNTTVWLLKVLEDNQIAYDQTVEDADEMKRTTLSVRFFNGSRSTTRITSEDLAIAEHIQQTLNLIGSDPGFEDIEALQMHLQVELFSKTCPPLVQYIEPASIE